MNDQTTTLAHAIIIITAVLIEYRAHTYLGTQIDLVDLAVIFSLTQISAFTMYVSNFFDCRTKQVLESMTAPALTIALLFIQVLCTLLFCYGRYYVTKNGKPIKLPFPNVLRPNFFYDDLPPDDAKRINKAEYLARLI